MEGALLPEGTWALPQGKFIALKGSFFVTKELFLLHEKLAWDLHFFFPYFLMATNFKKTI
jgi:hypothetical protein